MVSSQIIEIRKKAEKLDKAVIEIDMISGEINWVNEYLSSSIEIDKDVIIKKKLNELIPLGLQDFINDEINDKIHGKEPKFSIWPLVNNKNSVTWFYIYQTKTLYPTHVIYADIIHSTDFGSQSYSFMVMQMNMTNKLSGVNEDIKNLENFIKTELGKINNKHDYYDKMLEEVIIKSEKMLLNSKKAAESANLAANAAIQVVSSMEKKEEKLKKQLSDFAENSSKQTIEILRLIKSDDKTKDRMKEFESSMKLTTDLAVKSVVMRANEEGKNLSKKVTFPVSIIAAVATIIQFLIQNRNILF